MRNPFKPKQKPIKQNISFTAQELFLLEQLVLVDMKKWPSAKEPFYRQLLYKIKTAKTEILEHYPNIL